MATIRIDYYDKNRLPLLIGPVRTSVEQIRARHSEAGITIRAGWLYCPHLEVCVTTEDEIDVSPQLDLIRSWLENNPSTTQLKAEEYEALSRKVGVMEGITGPFLPMRPNNTVALVEDRPPRLVDGHEVLLGSYSRFFDRSVPILFRLAALKASDVSLATIVQVAMLARAAEQYEPEGLARGYLSLEAHADYLFANFDGTGQLRQRYERLTETWSEQLELAIQGRPELAAGSKEAAAQTTEIMSMWDEVLADAKADIKDVIRKDKSWFYYNPSAFPDELPGNTEFTQAWADSGMRTRKIEKGETLTTIVSSVDLDFFQSENFQTYRVLLNMYYSFLRTLNVSPAERFCLCYLVSSTFCRMRDAGQLDTVSQEVEV